MNEPNFFRPAVALDLATIAAEGAAQIVGVVDPARRFWAAAALDRAGPDDVAVFLEAGDLDDLSATRAGACFVIPQHAGAVPSQTIALASDHPLDGFCRVAALLHPCSLDAGTVFERDGIDPAANVHGTAVLEPGVTVEPGAVIGARVEIGAGTIVGAHSVIGPDVRIGRACAIGSHVGIQAALIGDKVIVHAGVKVGHAGPKSVRAGLLPRFGRVIIQDGVEIGPNATIERGGMGDTTIGEGSRIGSLVVVPSETKIDRHENVGRGAFSSSSDLV